MRISQSILYNCKLWPNRPAIILSDRVLTYAMLAQGVQALAAALVREGVEPGMRVPSMIGSPSWQLMTVLALSELGATSAPLQNLDAARNSGIAFDRIVLAKAPPEQLPYKTSVITDDWFRTEPLPKEWLRGTDAGALAQISFSSGTTGRPKAIGYTHANLIDRIRADAAMHPAFGHERTLLLMGLSTHFGSRVALSVLMHGKTLVFGPNSEASVQMANLYGIDALVGSNVQVANFAEVAFKTGMPLPSLRRAYFGGSLVTTRLLSTVSRQLPCEVVFGYGSSETGAIAVGTMRQAQAGDGVCGYVLPGVELEIVDDDDQPLPLGSEGLVRTRARSGQAQPVREGLTTGADFDEGGWHYPGDVGRLQPDGVLVLSGRTDEVLNLGGRKLAPEPYDEALKTAPGIVDGAVVQMEGQRGLFEVWAAVVAGPDYDQDQLLVWASQTFPALRLSRVVVVPQIPRTSIGKVSRAALKQRLEQAGN